jgi:Spy/CpxP family protein refolding chaperone
LFLNQVLKNFQVNLVPIKSLLNDPAILVQCLHTHIFSKKKYEVKPFRVLSVLYSNQQYHISWELKPGKTKKGGTRMKKLYWCLLGVPILIGLASYSIAQPGGGQMGKGRMGAGRQGFTFWKVEKIVEKLAITPDQIQQLDDLDYNFQMDSIDPEARIKKARLEMDHLLSQDSYSDEKVDGLVDEIIAGSSDRIKLGMNRQIATRKILTPEQWDQLQQMKEKRGRMMKKKRSGGQEGKRRQGGEEQG